MKPKRKVLVAVFVTVAAMVGFLLWGARLSDKARNPVSSEWHSQGGDSDVTGSMSVDAEALRRILRSDPASIADGLNRLGKLSIDDSAVDVLVAVWFRSHTSEPTLNWSALEREDIRLRIAGELVRASINGASEIPIDDVVSYATQYLATDGDINTIRRAIFIMGLAGNPDDLRRIGEVIVETQSVAIFEAGIEALFSTCSQAAKPVLQDVTEREREPFRRDLIERKRIESAAFRAARCRDATSLQSP